MEERRNPYSATLMVFALIGLIAGGALIVFGAMSEQTEVVSRGIVMVVGTYVLGLGAVFFILWIAVSAIIWSIGEAARQAAVVR
jgi:hypothetical protein